MDDLSAKLTELLNDPESMNRVRQMAESILGGSEAEAETEAPGLRRRAFKYKRYA